MNIDSELKKDGIEVISPLDKYSINSIANKVAESLCATFPSISFSYQDLFQKLSQLPMYIASMPTGIAEACYFYKNSSIYFRDGMGLASIEKFAIHECIHHLQEKKDKKNNLIRLGLCHFSGIRQHGMGLNEAAVQYITAKSLGETTDSVKYYGLSFSTISTSFYPLLCHLIEQIISITGEECLIESTFFNTDNFQETFICLFGKNTFSIVEKNFDKLLCIEESIAKLNGKKWESSLSDNELKKLDIKIAHQKEIIRKIFLQTQELILTSYFDLQFERISSVSEIEIYRHELYDSKDFLATVENEDSFFNNYYINQMVKLDEKRESFLNNTYLVTVNENKLIKLFRYLKTIFSKSNKSESPKY